MLLLAYPKEPWEELPSDVKNPITGEVIIKKTQ